MKKENGLVIGKLAISIKEFRDSHTWISDSDTWISDSDNYLSIVNISWNIEQAVKDTLGHQTQH